jgi:CxxC-x17-CxxC domain-containing protein
MKKPVKSKRPSEPAQDTPDEASPMNRIEERLAALERKIDTLINRSSPSRPERYDHPQHRPPEMKQNNSFRDRILHKAICADCNKNCEVPFKPTGDRPVYCKECFSKRKNPATFNEKQGNRPQEPSHGKERFYEKVQHLSNRKPAEKKKPAFRKKKR